MLDHANNVLHIAFSAAPMIAKSDKKSLINIYKELDDFTAPLISANSEEELKKLLGGQRFAQQLISETSKNKQAYYQKLKDFIIKYDQVLLNTHFKNSDDIKKKLDYPISPSGSELIYAASVGVKLQKKIELILSKMKQYQLTSRNDGYEILNDAHIALTRDINPPLLKKYEEDHLSNNKKIISKRASYWTYLIYPNAYFANASYEKIQNMLR